MDEETVKIRWSLSIGLIADRSDVYDTGMTREEWEAMDEDERESLMRDVVFEYLEWNYEEA